MIDMLLASLIIILEQDNVAAFEMIREFVPPFARAARVRGGSKFQCPKAVDILFTLANKDDLVGVVCEVVAKFW